MNDLIDSLTVKSFKEMQARLRPPRSRREALYKPSRHALTDTTLPVEFGRLLHEVHTVCGVIADELPLMLPQHRRSSRNGIIYTLISAVHSHIHCDIFQPFHPAAAEEVNDSLAKEYAKRIKEGTSTRVIITHVLFN